MKFYETNFDNKLRKFIFNAKRSDVIAFAMTIFAAIYHALFLVVFWCLKVYPMTYFNIFSVILFSSLIVMFAKSMINDNLIPYIISYCEVLAHQILADYFLGAQASFHYFILLIGLIAFLVLNNHFKTSIVFGILSSLIFIFIESVSFLTKSAYDIPKNMFLIIHVVNIFLGVISIFLVILMFVYMALNSENRLISDVDRKSKEIYIQHSKVEHLQNHIIISLSNLVENRDSDTGGHIQRTSEYVEMIARKAFEKGIYSDIINENFISLLKRAAPMHDVGKIVVPDSVLKKPGRLTEDEFKQMMLHTERGGKIIEEIVGVSEDRDYVRIATDVATYHHERWDGTGYPCRLSGNDIPVSARIMAIADVFDALISPRCYKLPMPIGEAFQIIRDESGSHFDPILADIFLSMKESISKVLEKHTLL